MATRNTNMSAHGHGSRDVAAFQQNIRYTNLAAFMYKVQERYEVPTNDRVKRILTPDGKHYVRYSERTLYNQLKSSRILTKDGEVRQDRLEKWAKARGFKAHLTAKPEEWGHITEGESP